jgi:NTP pyrophosphatase (non-canonical NTP hydrolase)
MLILPVDPKLRDFQHYVKAMELDRGFDKQDILRNCLLLGEEVGELFKAIRKQDAHLRIDRSSKVGSADEELADIFIYLCSIANRLNVNLEQAFRDKEERNKTRNWSKAMVN